jgi:hypothetical protein
MALTLEDRMDIRDLFARYGWAVDTGDSAGVADLFTQGAVVKLRETTLHSTFNDVLEWITGFHATNEGFRGRQHYMDQFIIDGDGERARVRAFWLIVKAETVTSKNRFIHNNGYYDNIVVKRDGRWLIEELRIGSWNDQDLPWVGPVLTPGVKAYETMAARRAQED